MSDPKVRSKFIPRATALAVVLILACVTVEAINVFQTAREAAIRSYLLSVCEAVEDYQAQHGQYPENLSQIDTTMLDYDLDIPLDSLQYNISDTEFLVSYREKRGPTTTCSRELTID